MRKLTIGILTIICFLMLTVALSAQEKFDIVSFKAPSGWQKSVESGAVQFTKQEGNAAGILMLFKSMPTGKDSRQTFDASWETLVKGLFDKVDTPQMQPSGNQKGWTIENGAAVVEKTGSKAVANLISASGGGKVVNLLIIYNSESFQPAIDDFIGSIVLPKVEANKAPAASITGANSINSPLAGKIWQSYTLEKYQSSSTTAGYNTGGFWIWQYKFDADGTYSFVYSGASALAVNPVNVLQYETGIWSINGNQLTIAPIKGSNEEWSVGKIHNGMSDDHIRQILETRLKWLKTQTRKLEKITYPFKIEYWEANKENALMLQHTQATEREGSPGVNNYSSFFEIPPERAVTLPDGKF